jgi:DNA-binding MarR family transcriptional regulator
MAASVVVDPYVLDSLMPDLVGHDRQPSAFLVYLYLYRHSRGNVARSTAASLQQIASDTGLSKSAVQQAIRTLRRRRLVQSKRTSFTAVPEYVVATPWTRASR